MDFLEALVRVALAYPFTDEQAGEFTTADAKFMFLIDVLDKKFGNLKNPFQKKLEDRTSQQEYDPRLVDNEPKRGDSLLDYEK